MPSPRTWLLAGCALTLLATPALAADVWLVGQGEEVRIQDGPHGGVTRSFSRIAVGSGGGHARRSVDWTGSHTYYGAPVVVVGSHSDGPYYGTRPYRYYPYRYARPYRRIGHRYVRHHTRHGRLYRSHGRHQRRFYGGHGGGRHRPRVGHHRGSRGGIGQVRGFGGQVRGFGRSRGGGRGRHR